MNIKKRMIYIISALVIAVSFSGYSGRHAGEPEMVSVRGGTFTMGSSSGENNEKPQHQVTLRSYNIGKYEVTQAQWMAVMGDNPSKFKGCDNCPVENVSWDDIQKFIGRLNELTGKKYRLPTEAEWEFAAREGVKKQKYEYSGSKSIDNVAWYSDNSDGKSHPVGTKAPNKLGIYDMSGNVWEWCNDRYGNYTSLQQTNPQGPSSGSDRVLRGGGWYFSASLCRVTYRDHYSQGYRDDIIGFRLALP
jgi:formylglycine-generating enzyme required for sulfatase activity